MKTLSKLETDIRTKWKVKGLFIMRKQQNCIIMLLLGKFRKADLADLARFFRKIPEKNDFAQNNKKYEIMLLILLRFLSFLSRLDHALMGMTYTPHASSTNGAEATLIQPR